MPKTITVQITKLKCKFSAGNHVNSVVSQKTRKDRFQIDLFFLFLFALIISMYSQFYCLLIPLNTNNNNI